MKIVGQIVAGLGTLLLLLALLMDTSVQTGYGRVHNIGLLNDRLIYLVLGVVLLVIGLAMILGRRTSGVAQTDILGDTRSCPFCAETIKSKAVICRYCGNSIQSITPDLIVKETKPVSPAASFGWLPRLYEPETATVRPEFNSDSRPAGLNAPIDTAGLPSFLIRPVVAPRTGGSVNGTISVERKRTDTRLLFTRIIVALGHKLLGVNAAAQPLLEEVSALKRWTNERLGLLLAWSVFIVLAVVAASELNIYGWTVTHSFWKVVIICQIIIATLGISIALFRFAPTVRVKLSKWREEIGAD